MVGWWSLRIIIKPLTLPLRGEVTLGKISRLSFCVVVFVCYTRFALCVFVCFYYYYRLLDFFYYFAWTFFGGVYTPGMNCSVLLLCSAVYCVFRRLKHVGRSPPRSVRFLTLNLRVALGADHHRYQRPVARGRAVHQFYAPRLVMPGYRTEVKILSRGLRKEVYRNSNLRVDIDLLEDPSAFPRVFFQEREWKQRDACL